MPKNKAVTPATIFQLHFKTLIHSIKFLLKLFVTP